MIFVFVAIATLFVLPSCNKEKKIMEETLVSALKSPSSYKFISFKEVETVTLADEVEDRLEHFKYRLSLIENKMESDSSSLVFYKRMNRSYGGYKESVGIYQKAYDNGKIEQRNINNTIQYLNNVKGKYSNIYNKPSFKTYELTYEAVNGFGASLKDTCYGRFNMKGELVAIKFEEDGSWNLLGNFFSIPNYYEMIKNN